MSHRAHLGVGGIAGCQLGLYPQLAFCSFFIKVMASIKIWVQSGHPMIKSRPSALKLDFQSLNPGFAICWL